MASPVPSRSRALTALLTSSLVLSSLAVTATASAQDADAPPPVATSADGPGAGNGAPSTTPVRLATSDGKGLIYLDGKLVGEGSFIGDLTVGTHQLRVTREGYDPLEEDLVVNANEPLSKTITLTINQVIETGPFQNDERLEGLYGGFGLLGLFTPGGTGSSIEHQCDKRPPELVSCKAGDGGGGGLGGFIGYHWDPVGLELFLAAQYDVRSLQNDWDAASTDPGIGPDPARVEDFTLRRLGGVALARVRLTHQWSKVRLGFALGAGVSYRAMMLDRKTHARDGSGARDVFVSNTPTYLSPVVGFEPSVMYRLSPSVSVALGAQLLLDAPATFMNDRENPKTEPETMHALGMRALSTPSYELASNMQVYVGPFLGMMFGP